MRQLDLNEQLRLWRTVLNYYDSQLPQTDRNDSRFDGTRGQDSRLITAQ